jgi:hypothetical protein
MIDDKKLLVKLTNNNLTYIFSYMALILTTSNELVVNNLSLIEENEVKDVKELFLRKLDAIDNIVGLAPTPSTPLLNSGR